MGHSSFHPLGIYSCQPLQVVLLGQELRLEPAHLTGAGSLAFRDLPSHDYSHGWVLGQATEDRLAQQTNQVVVDIASGTDLLEVVLSDIGEAQGIIKLSKGKKTSV